MHREFELWHFIAERLECGESTVLLVVAESTGSSPGRQGYKMAVASNGELIGSIGGGVMEVSLVQAAMSALADASIGYASDVSEQVHRKDVPNASGMICSGKQTVIFKLLTPKNLEAIQCVIDSLTDHRRDTLRISNDVFFVTPSTEDKDFTFSKLFETHFLYEERLGHKSELYIIGGGHCALALSELMSKMDFHISIFDDRPDLNTIEKNTFADRKEIIDNYGSISERMPTASDAYVVVMTLGYASDEIVVRQLINKDFKYFGVLSSKAKMATLMKTLRNDGIPSEKLDRIHAPIGLPINSRTPEEIAVSIAAEIIAVKNGQA